MKIKVLVKIPKGYTGKGVMTFYKVGDLIDLHTMENIDVKKGEDVVVSLGFACELPKGMIAQIYPRSSLFKKTGLLLTNSVGNIDNSYNGSGDIWKAHFYATRDIRVKAGVRLLQFNIVPSMYSTFFQKLRWMLSHRVSVEFVKSLGETSRGGFGEGTKGR